MELNSKKLERTSKIIYYTISIVLCSLLILLSSEIIGDLDTAVERPLPENFEDKGALAVLEKNMASQATVMENFTSKRETIEKTIAAANGNYANEKQSFDNWLETRKTLGSPDKDQEVVSRARKLDGFYKVEQDWREQLNGVQSRTDSVEKKRAAIQQSIDQEKYKAEEKYFTKMKGYDLKVFLIRLLFVAPILALGIFFFVRYRKHKFWPIYFGFSLFSVYAFFFGLVPYLPSYGGYIRYTVGIALCVGLGYYAIKRIRLYLEQKQAELKTSTQERSKKVQTETAEKSLENHFCPSCGKDFMMKKWEFPLAKTSEEETYKLVTSFCRHCGLELFKNCSTCGHKNFAHLPFCSLCGTTVAAEN